MKSWDEHNAYAIQQVMELAGSDYLEFWKEAIKQKQGVVEADVKILADRFGMETEQALSPVYSRW
jgi:hypothetical protein